MGKMVLFQVKPTNGHGIPMLLEKWSGCVIFQNETPTLNPSERNQAVFRCAGM